LDISSSIDVVKQDACTILLCPHRHNPAKNPRPPRPGRARGMMAAPWLSAVLSGRRLQGL